MPIRARPLIQLSHTNGTQDSDGVREVERKRDRGWERKKRERDRERKTE